MGEILQSNIKFYHPLVDEEGATHGGDIDITNEITSGVDENIFDNVTNTERINGDVSYRKVFVRNENTSILPAVIGWLSANSPASNVAYAIALGTNGGTVTSEATSLTYYNPPTKDHVDALAIGDLAVDGYQAIWIRQTVTAAGNGYVDNTFTLSTEMS